MAASNVYMNFSDVVASPQPTGTAVTIGEITDVQVSHTHKTEEWRASGRHYASLIVGTDRMRKVTITTGSLNKGLAIGPDTVYSLVWTLYDAKNKTGAGAVTYTMANAVLDGDFTADAKHNKFTTGKITFIAFSTDDSDPLTLVIA